MIGEEMEKAFDFELINESKDPYQRISVEAGHLYDRLSAMGDEMTGADWDIARDHYQSIKDLVRKSYCFSSHWNQRMLKLKNFRFHTP